jgi:hypothetical protein
VVSRFRGMAGLLWPAGYRARRCLTSSPPPVRCSARRCSGRPIVPGQEPGGGGERRRPVRAGAPGARRVSARRDRACPARTAGPSPGGVPAVPGRTRRARGTPRTAPHGAGRRGHATGAGRRRAPGAMARSAGPAGCTPSATGTTATRSTSARVSTRPRSR